MTNRLLWWAVGPNATAASGPIMRPADDGCVAGFPIVESITEPTLSDVVRKLVGEVNAASQPSWALPVTRTGPLKR